MKSIFILSILAALLGGCVIAPIGYGDNRDGYHGERSYSRGDGYYRDSGYHRGDGYFHDYSYHGERGN